MPVPKCLPLLWSKIEPGVVSGFWAKSQLKKPKKNINDSEILFIISFPQKFPYLLLVTLHNNRFSNLSKYRLVLKRNHAELVEHQQWHCIMGKRSCLRTLSNHYTCLIASSDARWWFLRYLSHLHPLWSRNSWTHRTDQTSASYCIILVGLLQKATRCYVQLRFGAFPSRWSSFLWDSHNCSVYLAYVSGKKLFDCEILTTMSTWHQSGGDVCTEMCLKKKTCVHWYQI